jgi:hypothetical protein
MPDSSETAQHFGGTYLYGLRESQARNQQEAGGKLSCDMFL